MRCGLPHLVTLIYTYELLLVQKYPNSKPAILSPPGIALCLCDKPAAHPICQDSAEIWPTVRMFSRRWGSLHLKGLCHSEAIQAPQHVLHLLHSTPSVCISLHRACMPWRTRHPSTGQHTNAPDGFDVPHRKRSRGGRVPAGRGALLCKHISKPVMIIFACSQQRSALQAKGPDLSAYLLGLMQRHCCESTLWL